MGKLIRINGREVEFPPDNPNLGELRRAERLFGVNFKDIDGSGMSLLVANLYIAVRRVDPTVTPEDIDELDPAILEQLEEDDASPPDEQPDGDNSRSSDSSSVRSDNSANGQSSTGSPGSDTTTASGLVTSRP